jgi:hypothetical protein
MIFDVESIGLHGEGWAVGYVILDGSELVREAWACCPPGEAVGTKEGRAWVRENCPWADAPGEIDAKYALPRPRVRRTPRDIRNWFWAAWHDEKENYGTKLWADVAWPVEARFLIACVEDLRPPRDYVTGEAPGPNGRCSSLRCWQGPFPLYDVSSYLAALVDVGVSEDAVMAAAEATDLRLPGEELLHHPLYDAHVSATKILTIEKLMHGLSEGGPK